MNGIPTTDLPRAEIRTRVTVPLRFGDGYAVEAEMMTFRGLVDGREHLALALGAPAPGSAPLVRLHSECLTGDVFGSARCDCGPQLREAVERIAAVGGYLLYLRQEGRGIGLYNKLDAYALQDQGLDTYEANAALGLPEDARDYTAAAQILTALGAQSLHLLSNNPDKAAQLTALGIHVQDRVRTGVHVTGDNLRYLHAKAAHTHHTIDLDRLPAQASRGAWARHPGRRAPRTRRTHMTIQAPGRMPSLYLSHGGPNLLEDAHWPGQLASWSDELPRPKAILMVSAHWEEAPLALGATTTAPLIYDFWGFPEHYYRLRYPAPGAPELADSVRKLLHAPGMPVADLPERGLDHGAYIPLMHMYPEADVPVLQISLPTLDTTKLMDIGRRLAPLRDEGYLIINSGSFTHNLRALNPGNKVPAVMAEFDDWGRRAIDAGDVDALLDFQHKAPGATFAHPRVEHFVPLAVTLGTAEDQLDSRRQVIEGTWLGLSKRSVQYG